MVLDEMLNITGTVDVTVGAGFYTLVVERQDHILSGGQVGPSP